MYLRKTTRTFDDDDDDDNDNDDMLQQSNVDMQIEKKIKENYDGCEYQWQNRIQKAQSKKKSEKRTLPDISGSPLEGAA